MSQRALEQLFLIFRLQASDMNIAKLCGDLPDDVPGVYFTENDDEEIPILEERNVKRTPETLDRDSLELFADENFDIPSDWIYRHDFDPTEAEVVMLPDGNLEELDVSQFQASQPADVDTDNNLEALNLYGKSINNFLNLCIQGWAPFFKHLRTG